MEENKQEPILILDGQPEEKTQKDKRNNKVVLICILAAIVFVCGVFLITGRLDAEQRQLYENCLDLKDRMKDPNSFILYDAVVVNYTESDGKQSNVYYIHSGGTNSYGTMVKDITVYWEDEYLGVYDELNEKEGPYDERTFWAQLAYMSLIIGADNDGIYEIEVDISPVLKKLK